MTTLIERAAKALMEKWTITGGDDGRPAVESMFRAQATAVLRAIREPSEAMMKAAEEVATDAWVEISNDTIKDIWRTMIDAALKEAEHG